MDHRGSEPRDLGSKWGEDGQGRRSDPKRGLQERRVRKTLTLEWSLESRNVTPGFKLVNKSVGSQYVGSWS